MSRPKKIHKPIKMAFNDVLTLVAFGTGPSRRAAQKAAKKKAGKPAAKSDPEQKKS